LSGWEQRRVLVIGLGRSGSSAARVLLRRGAAVDIADTATSPSAASAAAELEASGATVHLGSAAVDPAGYDLVVPSPGVAEHNPLLLAAGAAGVPVWSEPELAWQLAAGRTRLVAVTGTNGKTTTTELIAACLGAPTAGNIGTPLTELLDGGDIPPLVVAELSSFQLRFTTTLRPEIAVLLNVAEDHLDWHGTMASYRNAKARIWAAQQPGDTVVINADDPQAAKTAADHPPPGRRLEFTLSAPADGQVGVRDGVVTLAAGGEHTAIVAVDALRVAGPHNLANVCAATAAALAAGAPPQSLARPLSAYDAGRHRLEQVGTVGGVDYVDDSKATNPHAAAAALSSFPAGRVLWIAGGLGKGLSFDVLAPLVERHARAVFTIGTSGPAIAEVARAVGTEVTEAGTLDAAVRAAAAVAEPGDTVLLAPACASMDQFRDYAARGEAFRAAVIALADHPPQGAHCGS
jgi:UDP-N-acetylmuramoylalanine--D-glutamate ligase